MSQTGVKNNTKVAPLRMFELLAEIQEMKQRQEDDERGNSSSPDRSYSDSEDHNRGFYNSYKPDVTYPSSRAPKEQYLSDSQYNQTYPSNNSASKSKLGKSTAATPLQTPRKCKQGGSLIKSHKAKTPRSSAKKKTPHMFKSSGKKTTPFRKCLNMEVAFKSTKCSLFSSTKPPPLKRQNTSEDRADGISKALVPVPAITLDEVFASSLHIADDKNHNNMVAPHLERINPFKLNSAQAKSVEVFATPKSCNMSSNVLKGSRENNFITPLKPSDLSGIHKFETPLTQNKVIPYKSQHTPLVPINERATPSSQQASHKKTVLSVRDKENEASRANWQRKGFNKGDEINSVSRTPKQLSSALKENQFNMVEPNLMHNEINTNISDPPMSLNNILHKEAHSENFKRENQNSKDFPSSHLQYTSANKQPIISQNPQKDQINQIASRNNALLPSHQKERVPSNSSITISDYSEPVSIFPPKSNLDEIHQLKRHANPADKGCDLDRLLASRNAEYKSTPQNSTSERCPRSLGQVLPRQFRILTLKGTQYTVLGKIGFGGSSEVFKVMNPEDSSMYAVKCVNLAVDQHVAEGYINEIKLLQRLQGSDRVITMYDYEYVEKQRMLYVLLEMGDVDLSSLMKGYRARESRLPLPILVCYWTEMLSAVHHIHQHSVIHSDLKPANFLLAHGRLKLIDFGIASFVNADATSVFKHSTAGTLNYISPEALNVDTAGREPMKISYKSDVWSLGCILYSMLYGRTPFSHITHYGAKLAALSNPNQVITYPELEGVPPVLMKALRWCLTHNVKLRPTVKQLMDLPYLGGSAPGRIPLPIMVKVRAALTEDEWRNVLEVLQGK